MVESADSRPGNRMTRSTCLHGSLLGRGPVQRDVAAVIMEVPEGIRESTAQMVLLEDDQVSGSCGVCARPLPVLLLLLVTFPPWPTPTGSFSCPATPAARRVEGRREGDGVRGDRKSC